MYGEKEKEGEIEDIYTYMLIVLLLYWVSMDSQLIPHVIPVYVFSSS